MSGPLELEKTIDLPIARDRLWNLLSDTDRLNRSLGLAPVHYDARRADDGSLIRTAAMPMGFWKLRWREMPFEWVKPSRFRVQRLFADGPLREMVLGCEFEESASGTRLTMRGSFLPRHAIGRWLAGMAGAKAIKDMERVARALAATRGDETTAFPHRAEQGPVRADRLSDRRARLSPQVPDDLARLLATHLEEGADEDVIRMRPFALADRWRRPRLEVLKAFLAATREGLVELFWVPICPHCRGGRTAFSGLSDVQEKAFCASCQVDFKVDFDERLEVRFTVHEEIRAVTDAVFCIGGPGNTRHVLAQQRMGPGERLKLAIPLGEGTYSVTTVPSSVTLTLHPVPADSPARRDAGVPVIDLAVGREPESRKEVGFLPGEVELSVVNDGDEEVVVAVSEATWDTRAATAALVTSLAEFRDQFAADVLSPGCELAVRSLAVLFSDLRDSTALYDRVGDAPAYAGVREHFSFLSDHIRRGRGSIVKTMGDAVMAVFASSEDALAVCLEIQRDIGRFNEREAGRLGGHQIVLKLGVHRGPLIAVNSNDRLDYFGRTVNIAARAQQLSEGGDIVVTDELFAGAAGGEKARERGYEVEAFTTEVKGIARPIALRRLRPADRPR